MSALKVFIFYTHDSPEHEGRVSSLAIRLQQDGIQVSAYVINPAESEVYPQWMEREIWAADFVLLVFTNAFARKVWESVLIGTLRRERDRGVPELIPVSFGDKDANDIPFSLAFGSWQAYYRIDTFEGYEALYRHLTNRRWFASTPWAATAAAPEPPELSAAPDATRVFSADVWEAIAPEPTHVSAAPEPPELSAAPEPPEPPNGPFNSVSGWLVALPLTIVSTLVKLPAGVWRILTRFKLAPATQVLPGNAKADEVFFTVTAPASVRPGTDAELMIWAHLLEEQKLVLYKAMAALGIAALQKLLTRSAGPFPIQQGTILSLLLQIEGVTVANPHRHVTWTGAAGYANFIFSVPPDVTEGTRKAVCFIRTNGLEIARIDFLLRIGKERRRQGKVVADVIRYRKAFASYASEDRDAVLAHIHGMQKSAPHLDVFVDVITLRSGEDWARRLKEVIPDVDVFYLFWCRHARQSDWVNEEWRCAYSSRGLSFIDPVPLEPPDSAPPPEELRSKHFNDPILAFIKHVP